MSIALGLQNRFNLIGKSFVITGAAGQIGSSMIDACLELGANVIACDSSLESLNSRAHAKKWRPEKILKLRCDIAVREEVYQVYKLGSERFGRIDGVINNAGVSTFEPFLERTDEEFDWVMNVNLKGTFLCIQEYAKYAIKFDIAGTIVNIASLYGVISPDPRIYTDCERKNSEVYGATKAGIIQMTKYFAVHLAQHGIRVNGIAPGGVFNPENPQGGDFQKNYAYRCPMERMADVSEIVDPTLFLMMPAASYITGQTIIVDGGFTAW